MGKKTGTTVKGEYFYNGKTNKDTENDFQEMFNKTIRPNLEKYYGEFNFSIIDSIEDPAYDNEMGKGYKILFNATFLNPIKDLNSEESKEFDVLQAYFYAEIHLG